MALGVWAGVSSSALGFGPLFGAIINDSLGWSWIFLVNVPLGAGAWLVARAVLRESRAPDAPRSLDLVGAGLSAGGLLALLLALSQASGAGWNSPGLISLFAVAATGFALFIRHERHTKAPLLDLTLFKERSFAGANVLILMATAVMCSLFFFLALYMQTVLGYSALGSGATLLPLTLTIVVVAPLAGRLADRIGSRIPATLGMLLLAAGLLGLSTLGVKSSLGTLIPWLTLTGLGIGLVTTPTTTAALGVTGSEHYGTLAGVFNTFRATGLALGIAIVGAILASFGPNAAFDRELTMGSSDGVRARVLDRGHCQRSDRTRRRGPRRPDDALRNANGDRHPRIGNQQATARADARGGVSTPTRNLPSPSSTDHRRNDP